MARADKLLWAMKADPAGAWSTADIEALAQGSDIACELPPRGAHYALSHPSVPGHLTIPAARRIKPIYICLLIDMVERVTRR